MSSGSTDQGDEESLAALRAARDRAEFEAAVVHRQQVATERLGGLGSYDWDMMTGRVTWSDALFRIYGYEPGAFEPSYERFLEHVLPEDRETLTAVHTEAVRTGGSFETDERIVRADGDVRTLRTLGMVLTGEDGQPVRLHGVCRDVTEDLSVRDDARRAASRFETLAEAAPDAIVVADRNGRITSVNQQAVRLFGHSAATLTTMSVDDLVPAPTRGRHGELRAGYLTNPTTRPMAAGSDLMALRADGSMVPVDIALTPLDDATDGVVAAFVRDATQRRKAEFDARLLADAQSRRRQALELNDNVVQGLVTLLWHLDVEEVPASAREAAERTLAAARSMMSDLLEDLHDELAQGPGTLVRTSDVPAGTPPDRTDERDPATAAPPGTIRVVIADDAPDLRMLLRLQLERLDGVELVGEAADGRQAVDLCQRHVPDLVLLDLSMPELDGLQAAELIRERQLASRIYVLSGYPAAAMEDRAIAAGADAYFEKGSSLREVCDAITAVSN
ncbi:PAS domain S-box protein [Nitriliruptor alkaliphilus]|uniref:PAS domain S-box protein n=1 Tax=Nitriliruptor alkaliphilus TaxID=427918 RepID=UPI0006969B3E|nr:PAS domain S-box protein [Nitriliruptor alkaliphilus]